MKKKKTTCQERGRRKKKGKQRSGKWGKRGPYARLHENRKRFRYKMEMQKQYFSKKLGNENMG